MRNQKLGLLFLGCATLLLAADPFAGSWKMDPGKSSYKMGTAPKAQTVVITEVGADLDVNITGTTSHGTPIASRYTVPAKGGKGRIVSSPYDAVESKEISAAERETKYSKDGKPALTVVTKLAADGKSISAELKGTDGAGKPVDGTLFLEKQ